MRDGDSDSEDYIAVGTPLEHQVEAGSRRGAPPGDAGATRSLPLHKQEVVDEEGRRRFHGAQQQLFSSINTIA